MAAADDRRCGARRPGRDGGRAVSIENAGPAEAGAVIVVVLLLAAVAVGVYVLITRD